MAMSWILVGMLLLSLASALLGGQPEALSQAGMAPHVEDGVVFARVEVRPEAGAKVRPEEEARPVARLSAHAAAHAEPRPEVEPRAERGPVAGMEGGAS